jgi:hypothetical protein
MTLKGKKKTPRTLILASGLRGSVSFNLLHFIYNLYLSCTKHDLHVSGCFIMQSKWKQYTKLKSKHYYYYNTCV